MDVQSIIDRLKQDASVMSIRVNNRSFRIAIPTYVQLILEIFIIIVIIKWLI